MINMIKKFWNKNKIRKKMIVYFMLTTLLLGVTSLFTYYSVSTLIGRMNTTFTSNVKLNEINNTLDKVEQNLEDYLSTKHSRNLEDYYKYSDELKTKADKLQKDFLTGESSLLAKDIRNMIDTYIGEADAAVKAKRGRAINEYVTHYNEATRIFNYINLYIDKLNDMQFRENTGRYLAVARRLGFVELLNLGILFGVVAVNIILIFGFSYKITRPIISLSHSANEISRGNFDVQQVEVDTHDEISVMADAFNRMTASIKQYINEIREKAKLEGRLKEQEMQNLIMKTHLKEAELQALQSQINPHFLFNTLNTGAQLAMLEGADDTCVFIENVADLFRYNLRKLDKPSTLKEEVNNIDNYMYILKARFADRIDFRQDIDEAALDQPMPCMVLQPLVENAFIHGIGEMENGGEIRLTVKQVEDRVEVTVADNGKGMSREKIRGIFGGTVEQSTSQPHKKSGHTTGIGMNNVINRLQLFYNREEVLEIHSEEGNGTEIILRLPKKDSLSEEVAACID